MAKENIEKQSAVLAKIESGSNTPPGYDHKEYGSATEAAAAGHIATDRQALLLTKRAASGLLLISITVMESH